MENENGQLQNTESILPLSLQSWMKEHVGHANVGGAGNVLAVRFDAKTPLFSNRPSPKWVEEKLLAFHAQMSEQGYTLLGETTIAANEKRGIGDSIWRPGKASGYFGIYLRPEGSKPIPFDKVKLQGRVGADTDRLLQVELRPPYFFGIDKFLKSTAIWATIAVDRFGKDRVKLQTVDDAFYEGRKNLLISASVS